MITSCQNINHTLKHDLCTGCGICEGACPCGAITTVVEKGNFRPVVDAGKCTNCGRCVKACPGLGVDLIGKANDLFTDNGIIQDKMAGRYLKCYTGYSRDYDIRYHSASGGMVSQFLIWLLENKHIDGAVVTMFDKDNPLLVKTFIATTREDVISARSSKYSPVSFNHVVQDVKAAAGSRYVIVGLPCHIQGLRKLMAVDKRLREKVVGLFAIYCSCGRSFYLTEHVFKERGIDKSKLKYFQYRDEGCLGKMVLKLPIGNENTIRVINSNSESALYKEDVVYKEHYQSYYHPLRSFFIPRRCLFCIDHYGELGDVCFGDIHIKPYSDDKIGVNSLIVRKQMWLDLLLECQKSGAIELDEVSFKTVSDSQAMSFKKKGRNGAFINLCKKLGMTMPDYNVDYLRQPRRRDWIDYLQNRFQQFLGKQKSLWWLVSLMKSKVNIH